jgi:hypothetical protein
MGDSVALEPLQNAWFYWESGFWGEREPARKLKIKNGELKIGGIWEFRNLRIWESENLRIW